MRKMSPGRLLSLPIITHLRWWMRPRSTGDIEIRKEPLLFQTRMWSLQLSSSISIASRDLLVLRLSRKWQLTATRFLLTGWYSATNFCVSRDQILVRIKTSCRRNANWLIWTQCLKEEEMHITQCSDLITQTSRFKVRSSSPISMIETRTSTAFPTRRNSKSQSLLSRRKLSKGLKTCQLNLNFWASETSQMSLTNLLFLKKQPKLSKKQKFSRRSSKIN